MADGQWKLRWVAGEPGAAKKVVERLGRHGGWLTALSEPQLLALRTVMADCDLVEEVELKTFPQVVGHMLRMLGVESVGTVNRTESQALAEQILAGLPEDSILAPIARTNGLPRALLRTLRELRHHGCEPNQLIAQSDPRVQAVGEFYQAFQDALDKLGRSTSSDWYAQLLSADPKPVLPHRIVIFLGAAPPPDALRLIPKLAELGQKVEAILDDTDPNPAELAAIAQILGREIPDRPEPSWYHALLDQSPTTTPVQVQIKSAADPVAEVEWALREAIGFRAEGIQDHRIAILVPDAEVYVPLLLAIAPRLMGGLPDAPPPLDARLPMPLLANGFAAFLMRLLTAFAQTDVRDVPRLARSSYLGLSDAQQEALRTLCRRLMRECQDSWGDLLSDCQEKVGTDQSLPSLCELLGWRHDAIREYRTVGQWHGELNRLVHLPTLEAVVNERGKWRADCDRGAQTALLRCLAGHAAVVGIDEAEPISIRSFVELCARMWSREEVTLPTRRQGIRVVTSPEELGLVEAVIVLGATEGTLPRRRSEDPILFDADRAALQTRPVPLPNSHDKARHQRADFLRTLAAAGKRLVFFYPRTSEGSDNLLSSYVRDLMKCLPELEVHAIPTGQMAADPPMTPFDVMMLEALEAPPVLNGPPELTLPEAKNAVRPDLEAGISLRAVALASECPFRAVAQSVIGIRAPRPQTAFYRLAELPVRAGLHRQQDPESARVALEIGLRDIVTETLIEQDESEAILLQQFASRNLAGFVEREFAARQVWTRGDDERGPGRFDELGIRHEVSLDGQTIRFHGYADGKGEAGDFTVLRRFQSTGFSEIKPHEDPAKYLEWLLMFAIVGTKNPAQSGIEVDSPGDEVRTLVLLEAAGPERTRAVRGLPLRYAKLAKDSDMEARDHMREMKHRLRLAVGSLNLATMRPTPGEYCKRCGFGELCRVSSEFAESSPPEDPFAEAGA